MRAIAAITGTAGWQTAMTCRSGPKVPEHVDQVVDVIVEVEAALGERHHAGVGPIGDHHLMGRQEGLDRAAQQRRVMARHRGDDEELRLGLGRSAVARRRRSRRQKGRSQTIRSVTATSLPSIVVVASPKAGLP